MTNKICAHMILCAIVSMAPLNTFGASGTRCQTTTMTCTKDLVHYTASCSDTYGSGQKTCIDSNEGRSCMVITGGVCPETIQNNTCANVCECYEYGECVYTSCKSGYYMPTNSQGDCVACPANATCSGGTALFSCNAGYYRNGTSCSRCPSSGGVYGTSAAGSTKITDCYLPASTTGSDSTGTFTYTSNCYYVQ